MQAADILGISPRHSQRIKRLYEAHEFHELFDEGTGKARVPRVPIETVKEVFRLYQCENPLKCAENQIVISSWSVKSDSRSLLSR